MNLKSFHLFFIACSSALAFLGGAWALNSPSLADSSRLPAALACFGVAVALLAYEAWFVRYLRRPR
jgi:hypothetical protein